MTLVQQDLRKSSGPAPGHPRSFKKRKGVKISPEKSPELKATSEVLEREIEKAEKCEEGSKRQLPTLESVNLSSPKAQQLEKRKQEGNEWKALKKVDYQRLETVLEEVQLSGEAALARSSGESGKSEQTPWEVGQGRVKKPWFYNLMSITEHPEVLSGDEAQAEEGQEKQLSGKSQQNGERCENMDSLEGHGEPSEMISDEMSGKLAQDKRSAILNGMMEIFPIFSNDKFVCSRDAISIQECEELDGLEKALPSSGKFIIDSKTTKDSRSIDAKPFHSANSVKKGLRDRFTERLGNFKETFGGRLLPRQHSIFSGSFARQSSHFINFLLVLTPFAEEREKFLNEKKVSEGSLVTCKGSISEKVQAVESEGLSIFRIVYGLILTAFCLMSVVLGIAWRSYEPPGLLDFILSFIPFIHRRRTYFQVLCDKLLKILMTVFGDLCRNPFLP